MYHPTLGRFLQRDPIGYPDGLNAYAAVHIMQNRVDPYGLWTEQQCLDFFTIEGATDPGTAGAKGFFNAIVPFGDPLEIYPTYYDAVTTRYNDAKTAHRHAQQILNQTQAGSAARTNAERLVDEAEDLVEEMGSDYRFFRFMQRYGCACEPVRDAVQAGAEARNWHEQSDKVLQFKKHLTKILTQVLKRVGQGGNPITRMDITGALAARQALMRGAANAVIDMGLRVAQREGEIGECADCPPLDLGVSNWYDAVDDSGEPVL